MERKNDVNPYVFVFYVYQAFHWCMVVFGSAGVFKGLLMLLLEMETFVFFACQHVGQTEKKVNNFPSFLLSLAAEIKPRSTHHNFKPPPPPPPPFSIEGLAPPPPTRTHIHINECTHHMHTATNYIFDRHTFATSNSIYSQYYSAHHAFLTQFPYSSKLSLFHVNREIQKLPLASTFTFTCSKWET